MHHYKQKAQAGVGLLEVLVALILLAIGVLGYVALQLRAMDASSEALSKSLWGSLQKDYLIKQRTLPEFLFKQHLSVLVVTFLV